ncbi:hypothetical protein [Parvibaculum sp.]|uniref:hypothetical protein n=1 Tax=Parvibaculum sp. TaxID=2024848 RepID=UPI003BAD8E36
MELILHIGDGKCGTSSVQSSLFDARDALRGAGILYHPVTRINGHFHYRLLWGASTRGNDSNRTGKVKKNRAETTRLIEEARPRFLLLSAESFFYAPPRIVLDLFSGMPQPVEKIHVIGYIRNPVEHFLSLLQQKLKGSHKLLNPEKHKRNFLAALDRWQKQPDVNSLTVRNFDRRYLSGGSVVSDFQNVIRDITNIPIDLADRVENSSLSAEQMIVLHELRKDHLADFDGKFHPLSHSLIGFFRDLNRHEGLIGTKPGLRRSVEEIIHEKHHEDVVEVEARFPETRFTSSCQLRQRAPEMLPDYPGGFSDLRNILSGFDENIADRLRAVAPDVTTANHEIWAARAERNLEALEVSGEAIELFRKYAGKLHADVHL